MGVDWHSPEVVNITGFVFGQVSVVLTGMYLWELVLTFSFEWQLLVTFKKKWCWPYVPYLLARYSLLTVLIALITIARITTPVNCAVIFPAVTTIGLVASTCSSVNLMLRTLVLWQLRRKLLVEKSFRWFLSTAVIICLIAGAIGQLGYSLFIGMTIVTAYWSPEARSCVYVYHDNARMASVFIYNVVFDFIIMVLAFYRIFRDQLDESDGLMGTITSTMKKQGAWYFVLTFVVNVPAVIFIHMNLNDAMNSMFAPLATTVSVILSCRAVTEFEIIARRLRESEEAEANRRQPLDTVTNVRLTSRMSVVGIDSGKTDDGRYISFGEATTRMHRATQTSSFVV